MFAAGLVKVLAGYPEAVIDRAVDATGIPSEVSFLNIAEIKKHLDAWRTEYLATEERRERANRKTLPEPTVDPEERKRVSEGLRDLVAHLKSGFSPGTI